MTAQTFIPENAAGSLVVSGNVYHALATHGLLQAVAVTEAGRPILGYTVDIDKGAYNPTRVWIIKGETLKEGSNIITLDEAFKELETRSVE